MRDFLAIVGGKKDIRGQLMVSIFVILFMLSVDERYSHPEYCKIHQESMHWLH